MDIQKAILQRNLLEACACCKDYSFQWFPKDNRSCFEQLWCQNSFSCPESKVGIRYTLKPIELTVLGKIPENPFERAVYNSVMQLGAYRGYTSSWARYHVKNMCNITVHNLNFLANNATMRKQTLLVRYEDLASDPQGYAKKIYQFTGLKFYGQDFEIQIKLSKL